MWRERYTHTHTICIYIHIHTYIYNTHTHTNHNIHRSRDFSEQVCRERLEPGVLVIASPLVKSPECVNFCAVSVSVSVSVSVTVSVSDCVFLSIARVCTIISYMYVQLSASMVLHVCIIVHHAWCMHLSLDKSLFNCVSA